MALGFQNNIYGGIWIMNKRRQDVIVGEEKRQAVDNQVNNMAFQENIPLIIRRQVTSKTGLTRELVSNSKVLFLLEERFYPSNLYLKGLKKWSVGQAFNHFKEHYFFPLKIDKNCVLTHYHKLLKIGDIPGKYDRKIENCFYSYPSKGNENRFEFKISKEKDEFNTQYFEWIPIDGSMGMLESQPPLIEYLKGLINK